MKTKCLDNTLKTWWQHQRWSNSHQIFFLTKEDWCLHCFVQPFIMPTPILLFFGQVFQGTEERPSKWHLFIFLQNWPAFLYHLANKFNFVFFIYLLFNKKQLKLDNRRTKILFGVDPKIILSGQAWQIINSKLTQKSEMEKWIHSLKYDQWQPPWLQR